MTLPSGLFCRDLGAAPGVSPDHIKTHSFRNLCSPLPRKTAAGVPDATKTNDICNFFILILTCASCSLSRL